ncbi:MAG: tripartite tricarboxylate transporter substrate-binding protein [Burkholderiales bacterium]
MRNRILALLSAMFAFACLGVGTAHAQQFYQGKTLRIIVGLSPGGGFDTYARTIGRHLGKHVPGNPTVIVDNMPGAGSIIMANYMYKVEKPDGLTMGHFNGALILGQVLGQAGIEFDARKFEYVGAAVNEDVTCSLSKSSGVTNVDQWKAAKTPLKLGGVAPGATPDNSARILHAALGLPVQVVSGYKGTSLIRLAVESGELAGACWSWQSMRVTWRKAIDGGEVTPVVQIVAKPFPDIPKVPLAIDLATTEEAKQLIKFGVQNASFYARPFILPPGTPKDRVETLRTAFQATLKDPDFLAEAKKARLIIDPVSGEEMQKLVADVFTMSPVLQAKLKEALYSN